MLIVEDGTGLSNAESYVSVAFVDNYFNTFYSALPSYPWKAQREDLKEIALRQVTSYYEFKYAIDLPGIRKTSSQNLSWPRIGALHDGSYIDSAVVPTLLKQAIAELAIKYVTDPSLFFPDRDSEAGVAEESVSIGSVSVSTKYSATKNTEVVFAKIEAMLSKLVGGSRGGSAGRLFIDRS